MAGIRLLLCVASAFTTLAACSYDWSVEPADAGVDAASDVMTQPDVVLPEAGEAGGHDASAVDSGKAPKDSGAPPSDGGLNCAALTQQLLAARDNAIKCNEMGVMPCVTTVPDECGCEVAVGGTPNTDSAFTSAVMAFTKAMCSTSSPEMLCPPTCPTVSHLCLAMEAGASYTCL